MMQQIIRQITLLLLSLPVITATAQQVTFKGKVTNEKGSPVEIATVSLQGTAIGTMTDLKGKYSLTCESRDTMIVVFSMVGHQTRKRTFYNPTDTITRNITLPTTGYSLEGVEITDEELGKSIGSDSEQVKSTFVTVCGIDKAKEAVTELSESAANRWLRRCAEGLYQSGLAYF